MLRRTITSQEHVARSHRPRGVRGTVTRSVICLTLALFVSSVTACRSEKTTALDTTIHSQTIAKAWWPAWDSFQIGVQRREMKHRSYQTSFAQRADYIPALNLVEEGKADAATLTIYEAIEAIARGTPIKIVLLLDYTIGSDGVVANEQIATIRDLEGKRVGVESGTISHFTLLKALEKAGLEPTDVELVSFSFDELQQAFVAGRIDAIGIYEPYMSNMVKKAGGHVIFSSKEIPRSICDVLFVHEKLVRDSPEVVEHWIEAWSDALRFRAEHNETYLQQLSNLNGTPVTDLRGSLKGIFLTDLRENRLAFGTSRNPGYLLDALNEMQQFMLEQGVIDQRLSLRDALYFDGVESVRYR